MGQRQTICSNCQQPGHTQKNCPQPLVCCKCKRQIRKWNLKPFPELENKKNDNVYDMLSDYLGFLYS